MPVDFKGRTPDITPAQVAAVVGAFIALGAAFGLNISHEKRDALLNFAQIMLPVLIGADALIRHGRSRLLTLSQVAERAPQADRAPAPSPGSTADGNDAAFDVPHAAGRNGGTSQPQSPQAGGSEPGPFLLPRNYRGGEVGVRSYLPG